MPRKIAFIGTAESSKAGPYQDKSWEIWGVSGRHPWVTRADRWFEIHRLDGEPRDWAATWRKTLSGFIGDAELWMFYPEPLAKKVIQYPVERMSGRFGTFFATSTFAWMFMLAIDELCPLDANGRPTIAEPGSTIGIWGVDMEYGTEYRQQRAGMRHFMELARALGIEVMRLADGGLAYDPVPYPLWQDDPLLAKVTMRNKKAKDQLAKFDESIAVTREMIASTKGALSEIEQMLRQPPEGEAIAIYNPQARRSALEKQLEELLDTSATISKDIVHWNGIDEEQRWILDYLQP